MPLILFLPKEMHGNYEILDSIRKDKFGKPTKAIDKIRTDIYTKVIKSIEENYDKSKIFSITAPTGTGKTITGFFCSFKIERTIRR